MCGSQHSEIRLAFEEKLKIALESGHNMTLWHESLLLPMFDNDYSSADEAL